MKTYVGLDVSLKQTAVCVVDEEGKRVWQGRCSSHPDDIAELILKRAPGVIRIALETGPVCVWHWHSLREAGLPVVCIHARHARAALMMQLNKRIPMMRLGWRRSFVGWYREVEVKSLESHRVRLLLSARSRFVCIRTGLYNQIRGLVKTFGVVLDAGKGGTFVRQVEEKMPSDPIVGTVIGALLTAWKAVAAELRKLDRNIEQIARTNPLHQALMTVPGVGAITAAAYVAKIDSPERFAKANDVGAYLGLTPRRYQSGEVDRAGRISKCGDSMLRTLLFEAAHTLLTRTRQKSKLRTWGLALDAQLYTGGRHSRRPTRNGRLILLAM